VTWREFIYKAVEQAQRGLDPNRSKLMDAEGLAEVMAPAVLHEVSKHAARNERLRSLLTSTFTLSITNGLVTLEAAVLTEYLCESTLADNADTAKRYSHILNWGDFIRPRSPVDKKLGWYSIQTGTTMGVIEPSTNFTPGSGLTASRTFTCPRAMVRPATADTAIDGPDEIIDDGINLLSEMIRGKIALEAA
jgi:hypothetical protein